MDSFRCIVYAAVPTTVCSDVNLCFQLYIERRWTYASGNEFLPDICSALGDQTWQSSGDRSTVPSNFFDYSSLELLMSLLPDTYLVGYSCDSETYQVLDFL